MDKSVTGLATVLDPHRTTGLLFLLPMIPKGVKTKLELHKAGAWRLDLYIGVAYIYVFCLILNYFYQTLKISDLTYKVVAFLEVPNFDTDECIDWAIEMIFLGYDTPSLLILAGFHKPTNYFKVVDYLPQVLLSLNLTVKIGDEATLSYCSYYIQKIASSDNVRDNLIIIYKFCQAKDYEELVYDFYLLYWAWDDINYGDAYTSYWENANKENIEKLVVETAQNWIAENKKYYSQQKV